MFKCVNWPNQGVPGVQLGLWSSLPYMYTVHQLARCRGHVSSHMWCFLFFLYWRTKPQWNYCCFSKVSLGRMGKNLKIMHVFCYNSNNTGMLYKENVNVSAKPLHSSNQYYQSSVMMFYPPFPMLFVIVCKHILT